MAKACLQPGLLLGDPVLEPLALLDQLRVAGLVRLQGFEASEDRLPLGRAGFDLRTARQGAAVDLDATMGILGLHLQGLDLLERAPERPVEALGLLALALQPVALLLEHGAPGREAAEVRGQLLQRGLGSESSASRYSASLSSSRARFSCSPWILAMRPAPSRAASLALRSRLS